MARVKKAAVAVPTPVKIDSRICFGIAYFTNEADAAAFATANPSTYNGGYFHGRPTGRDTSFDYPVAGHGTLLAVTY